MVNKELADKKRWNLFFDKNFKDNSLSSPQGK